MNFDEQLDEAKNRLAKEKAEVDAKHREDAIKYIQEGNSFVLSVIGETKEALIVNKMSSADLVVIAHTLLTTVVEEINKG